MKNSIYRCCFVLFLLLGSLAVRAGSATVDDYAAANTSNTPRTLNGNAVLMTDGQASPGNDGLNDTSYMRLVPNLGSQSGFVTSNQTVTGTSSRVLIDFDYRVMNGTATPADGMGFALINCGSNPATGAVTWSPAETPLVPGSLGVAFLVYNGGAGGARMRIYFNSVQVGTEVILSAAPYNYTYYRGINQTNQLAYDHVSIDAKLAAATVSVTITPNGGAAIPVYTNLAVPGMTPYIWRVGFGARTGGSNAIYDIDNVIARNPTPPTITSPSSPLTIPEDSSPQAITLITTDPDGPPFTYTITGPVNGVLTGTAPNLMYKPNPNFFGSDSITVVATDSDGYASTPFVVPITVTSVNDGAPIVNSDSASTTDGQAVTISVLANDTIVDLPYTLAIATQPSHGTVVINGNTTITYSPTPGYAGPDSFTYRVSDFENDSATGLVSITVAAVPPAIVSPLLVNAVSTLLFNYTIVAIGTQPITLVAAPLPPGVTLVGNTLQGFVPPGSYAVTLAATNGSGTDVRTLVINSVALQPGSDTDGDGFPDELEVAVGSSPVDPLSTPLTVLKNAAGALPAGAVGGYVQAKPFFLSRSGVALRLNFNSQKLLRDSISIGGALPLPATFTAPTQSIALFVGGVSVAAVLDERGQYTSKDGSIRVKVGRGTTSVSGRNSPLGAKLRGVFAGSLADEGFVNADITKAYKSVVVYVLVGSEYFTATARDVYSARTGKSGAAKAQR